MGACCSQSDDLSSLSDILSDLDDGAGNEQVTFRVSQRVRCKDKGDAQWRTGTVTSSRPLKVQIDGWDSAFSWDQVEAISISTDLKTPTASTTLSTAKAAVAFCVSQRVRCKDKGDTTWRSGTVTSSSPLTVQVDGWDSAHSWDQVEAIGGSADLKTPTASAAPAAEAAPPPPTDAERQAYGSLFEQAARGRPTVRRAEAEPVFAKAQTSGEDVERIWSLCVAARGPSSDSPPPDELTAAEFGAALHLAAALFRGLFPGGLPSRMPPGLLPPAPQEAPSHEATVFAATPALSRDPLSSDVQPPVAPRKPDSLGFAMQRALPRSGQERADVQQTQALVSQRAAELNLPERLTLGLSVDVIEKYIAFLPADAVEQCNEDRPTINGIRVPANAALNGYVNQWLVSKFSEANGGKAICESLYERGDPGVGVATVFVSWFLETPLKTLVDALRQYLRLHPELPPDTKFWVCDFVIRQSTRQLDVTMNDVKRLGDCVRAVGHTVLLMEPFDNPMPLRRAYCIKEVFHTQASGARFEVVMSAEQQAAFETALVEDFASITKKLSEVDVRKAECRNPKDTEQILGELDREVGLTECNKAVFGLLRGALAGQGRAALDRMASAERATSMLINQLGIRLYC